MNNSKVKREKGKVRKKAINKFIILTCSFAFYLLPFTFSACAHPAYEGREVTTKTFSRQFTTDANQAYYAVRWALKTDGYAITEEDLQNGLVKTGWLATKVDSHYLNVFGRRDYGVNGGYYMLDVVIKPPEGGQTEVSITSHVKSIMANLKSSGIEEKKILRKIADYLRSPNIKVTNIGVEE